MDLTASIIKRRIDLDRRVVTRRDTAQPELGDGSTGKSQRNAVLAGFIVVLSMLGLYVSLCHVYAVIAPDSDLADPVMLWQGVHAHGIGFLRDWYYNPDNYLLSLIPFTSLAFEIFGTLPGMVVGMGWVILVGCAALAAWITWTATRRPLSALVFPLLLLANQDAIGRVGFLGYAVTHNISMFWGLLSLLAALRWVQNGNTLCLAASAAALFVGTISDPWLGAAADVPLIAADAVLLASGRPGERGCFGWLLAAHVAAFWLARNQLFGVFGFLPKSEYPPADWSTLCGNLLWMGRVLMLVFDPVPGTRTYVSYSPIRMLLVLTPVAVYLLCLLVACVRRFRSWHGDARFVALACVLSFAGTMSAFLLVTLPQGPWMGRFFLNLYVLLPVLGCVACLAPQDAAAPVRPTFKMNRRLAAASIVAAGLSMLSGLASHSAAWAFGPRPLAPDARELGAFLDDAGLHYGFGAHWASNAEAVTWLSQGRVRIRPVVFDPHSGRISPQFGQTSSLWYRLSDRPAGPIFVVVGHDVVNCKEPASCIAGVSEQFGAPDRVLRHRNLQIMVWNRMTAKLDGEPN